jgi:hypothetical protein
MSYIDLNAALRDWPYEPEKISVRKILGTDETVRIQMRVELGIIQMEAEGRPDNARPFGFESLLAYHLDRLEKYQARHGSALGCQLSREECEALRLEASLYYRRYIALFVLEEFEGVLRDTAHSLAIFDLCREFAQDTQDRVVLEEFRAYVLMMHARALAYHALQQEEPASALAHVNRGILDIRAHFEAMGKPELFEKCEEVKILRALAKEVERKLPSNSVVRTRKALRVAIEQERFEEAAQLRDRLRKLYQKAG